MMDKLIITVLLRDLTLLNQGTYLNVHAKAEEALVETAKSPGSLSLSWN